MELLLNHNTHSIKYNSQLLNIRLFNNQYLNIILFNNQLLNIKLFSQPNIQLFNQLHNIKLLNQLLKLSKFQKNLHFHIHHQHHNNLFNSLFKLNITKHRLTRLINQHIKLNL